MRWERGTPMKAEYAWALRIYEPTLSLEWLFGGVGEMLISPIARESVEQNYLRRIAGALEEIALQIKEGSPYG